MAIEQKYNTLLTTDALKLWEPYWCGMGAPTANFYCPLNKTGSTPMFQAYTNNGFTDKASSSYFKIDGNSIYGA